MHQNNCLNCAQQLEDNDKFCSNCSQTAHTHRLTLPHIIHEVVHATTHADKGIFYLIKELAVRPGFVAKEYIEGKRKKYFNPFTLLILCAGFFVFMGSLFHPFSQELKPKESILKKIRTEEGRQQYIGQLKRTSQFTHFAEKYSNVMTLLSTPLISLVFLACFRKRKYNYAEHLVANVFFAGFYSIISTIIIIPLMGLSKGGSWYGLIVLGNFILHGMYNGWAYYQLMGYTKKIAYLRTFLISMLAILAWVVFSSVMNILYTIYGG